MKVHNIFIIVCLLLTTAAYSQKKKAVTSINTAAIRQMAYADSARLVEIYKDLHQNPELGFQETRTSGILAMSRRDETRSEV